MGYRKRNDRLARNTEGRQAPDSSAPLSSDVRVAAERHLVRTLDMRLLPTIIIIFIMNYIDVSPSEHLKVFPDEMKYFIEDRYRNCSAQRS